VLAVSGRDGGIEAAEALWKRGPSSEVDFGAMARGLKSTEKTRALNRRKRERVDEALDQPEHGAAVLPLQLAAEGVHEQVGVAENLAVPPASGASVGPAR
jgi:hypothetical protein